MNTSVLFGLKNGVTNIKTDITLIVLFAAITLLTILVAVWLINLSINRKTDKIKSNQLLGIMLVASFVGLAVRIVLSVLIVGHKQDFNTLAGEGGIVSSIINDGFSGYYSNAGENAIYPLSLYLFSIFATLGSWFGVTPSSAIMPLLIKLPLILADIGCVVLLYKCGKKYFNQVVGVCIGGLYALCPVFMFPSSVWGSYFAILALFLLLTFYFLVEKKYLFMFISYSLALLTAKEALYLYPVIAVFVIYRFVAAIKKIRQDRVNKLSFLQLIKSPDKGLVIRLPLYFIACILGMYLISLPFIIKDYNANIFVFVYEFFIAAIAKVGYYGYNSLSLYNIFNMNGSMFNSNLVPLFAVLFLVIITGLTLMYYLSKKNRANLVMLGAFVYLTLSIFFIDFRELTTFPLLAIMLFAFILIKDKRLLQVFALYAVILVLNASVVMAYAGYFNNISFTELLANNDYVSGTLLSSTTGKALNIVFSALAVVCYLHFTFVLMDISMNKSRKPFEGQKGINPLISIKHWIWK